MIFLLKTFIYRVSIVKLTKFSKFEFEVRFLKNQKNYKNSSSPKFDQNSIFGSIEPNREKRQNNAKIRVRYGRTFSCFIRCGSVRFDTVRYGSGRVKSPRVSLYK
jgi:hypothetical protein